MVFSSTRFLSTGAVLFAVLLGAGCSSSTSPPSVTASSAAAGNSVGAATDSAAAATQAGSPGDSATSTAGGAPVVAGPTSFALPTAACTLVNVQTIEQISKLSGVTGVEIPPSGTGNLDSHSCQFSAGTQTVGLLTFSISTAQPGETALQLLGSYNGSGYRSVPGLGDAALFYPGGSSANPLAQIEAAQVRGNEIALLIIACVDPGGAQVPVITLARAVLSQLT